jgi:hypothetical protein
MTVNPVPNGRTHIARVTSGCCTGNVTFYLGFVIAILFCLDGSYEACMNCTLLAHPVSRCELDDIIYRHAMYTDQESHGDDKHCALAETSSVPFASLMCRNLRVLVRESRFARDMSSQTFMSMHILQEVRPGDYTHF